MSDNKKHLLTKPLSRRGFFKDFMRFGLLGGIGVFCAGYNAKRNRLAGQGKCVNNSGCAGCGVLNYCRLPAALKEKING